jgi:hypothetical protein
MPTNFWNNPTIEPKRNFRFLLSISNFADATWLVKTADRPKASVSSVPHQYINHTFNYPGRLVWNPVSITMVDPAGSPSDTTKTIRDFLEHSGYKHPTENAGYQNSASALLKNSGVTALGNINIRTLAASAGQAGPVSSADFSDDWELHNAFIQGDIDFGSLDYGNEELLTISFTLQYDWATLAAQGSSGAPGNFTG